MKIKKPIFYFVPKILKFIFIHYFNIAYLRKKFYQNFKINLEIKLFINKKIYSINFFAFLTNIMKIKCSLNKIKI